VDTTNVHERLHSLKKIKKTSEQCKLESEINESRKHTYRPKLIAKNR
jgi:hypothetical protein